MLICPDEGQLLEIVRNRGLADEFIVIPSARRRRATRLWAGLQILYWALRERSRLIALHANGPEELNIVALAALVTRTRVLAWSHVRDITSWGRVLAWLSTKLLGEKLQWASVSQLGAAILVEAGLARPGQIEVIPNPVDPADVCRERASRRTVTVGYVGSAIEYKGFHLIPDVVERCADCGIMWQIFTDPLRPDDITGQRLRTWENVNVNEKTSDVSRAYAACDVIFCPSLSESFARVPIEAMMNGLPVVASDLPTIRDHIGSNEAGVLFSVGDVDAAAHAIRRLVRDPSLRQKMGDCGKKRAESYKPARVMNELFRAYGLMPRAER